MKEFFVTLLSNSSMNLFPDNKTSSFTVQLAEKITLNGLWSVGVAEIHYNYNFFNVTPSNNSITAVKKEDESKNSIKSLHTVNITPGYYGSVADLVDTVNLQMKKHWMVAGDLISIDKSTTEQSLISEAYIKNWKKFHSKAVWLCS